MSRLGTTKKSETLGKHSANEAAYVHRAHTTLEVLFQGKWQLQIICALRNGPLRIGQLGRLIPGASKKMLTQGLRKLEANGIIVRRDLSLLVLHVEYELHPDLQKSVLAIVDHLSAWSELFLVSESCKPQ